MLRDATAPRPLIREAARVPKTCGWRPPGRMQRPGGVSRRLPTCLRLQLLRQPRPRLRLLPRWLRRLPLPLLLLLSLLLDGLDLGPPLLPAAPAARGWAKARASPCQVARVAARFACEESQGSGSAVSGLWLRARMAEAWAADALPGACAMSTGCSRSEHASLERAHTIRGSARGRGPGCGRNVPSRARAHPSCALRQQRRR